MKTFNIKGKIVKLYDSIDEMPIKNFQKYNKYILIDAGIGSDLNSIDSHIITVAKLMKTDINKAAQELQNLRQNLYMISSEISPKYMAFASLIHSIDGKELIDLSDDNLKQALNELNEIKHSVIFEFLAWLKKKLATELETYFPADFSDAKEKEVYDKLKQRALLILKGIEDDSNVSEEINEIDAFLFSLHKPKSFMGPESVEVKYDKQFETSCMLISQKTGMNAKSMTVLEFYNTLSNISKQAEMEIKANKHVTHKRLNKI